MSESTPPPHRSQIARRAGHGSMSIVQVLMPWRPRNVVLAGVSIAALAALLWISPLSPAALGRADARLGDGSPQGAAQLYDGVARWSPFPWQREQAIYRSAMVWSVDLGDAVQARRRLHRLIREYPESPLVGESWERIGHLHMTHDRHPVRAANAFERSFQTNTRATRAARRLELAARARAEANQLGRARELWLEIENRFPEHRVAAIVGRAGIALGERDAQGALLLYEEASRIAADPHQRSLARLGIATCLERLGDLDQALAAIDLADLPDIVVERRREGIRARSLAESGGL